MPVCLPCSRGIQQIIHGKLNEWLVVRHSFHHTRLIEEIAVGICFACGKERMACRKVVHTNVDITRLHEPRNVGRREVARDLPVVLLQQSGHGRLIMAGLRVLVNAHDVLNVGEVRDVGHILRTQHIQTLFTVPQGVEHLRFSVAHANETVQRVGSQVR